jgi:hypothetical protein
MATYESRRYNTPVPDASKIADGSVDNTEFQHLDGVTSDIQTQMNARLPLAGGTVTGNVIFNDNASVYVGTGQDARIFHDGSNTTIKNDTGALIINANTLQLKNNANDETLATFANGGAVNLRFNDGTKLETTNTGVNVTGELGATGNITASGNVNGNGQNLTNINGSNISSGTVADARISALTASKLTGALPAIDGSALTGIDIAPSTATSVGALKYFAIYYKNSGGQANSISISVGTEITPSTYEVNNMYVTSTGLESKKTGGTSGQLDTSALGYLIPGFSGAGNSVVNKTRATETGTWRCISQATYNAFNTTGQNGGNYVASGGGLFQRVS